jgi:glycosyltransferase involved in cell wall biosynthesis
VTDPITVLQSFPPPLPTTNPYSIMLPQYLRKLPGVSVLPFSWRTALLGRYDVFHVHWPEILVSGQSPAKKLVRQGLFVLLLARLEATRVPLVRTVHNLGLPSGITRRETALLHVAERLTTLRIIINPTTPIPADQPSACILHGDYRAWYAGFPRREVVPGRILYFGTIRRYKNVPALIRAIREIIPGRAEPELSVHVAGRLSTPDLEAPLRELAGPDPRIALHLDFIDDEHLVLEVSAAELVVLPYTEMHNSGSVLATLSLGRPVLTPRSPVNDLLEQEVGQGWIHQYDGALSGRQILDTLEALRRDPPPAPPELSARDWQQGARDHLVAYRRAVELRRGRARRGRARRARAAAAAGAG